MAKVNLIDYAELCDMSFSAMLKYEKTYIRTAGGTIYVPPPVQDVRKAFSKCLDACVKAKFSPYDGNFVVRSCRPCDNWRLKHVGGRYRNMVEARRIVPVKSKVPLELDSSWAAFLDRCWAQFPFVKFEVDSVDYDDVYDSIALTDSVINMKYSTPVVVVDANRLIDRSAALPMQVTSQVNRAFTEAKAV